MNTRPPQASGQTDGQPNNQPVDRLLPHHRKMLEDSAIPPALIAERGYFSAESKSQLRDLGFGQTQQQVPTLVVPIHGTNGDIVTYQHRPDRPRVNKGKALKYETLAGNGMHLDVPPSSRAKLGDPNTPLFITEGSKKADSAVAHGLCCVALLGVWNFRGRNEDGGLTALGDWEYVTFKHQDGKPRQVYIVFDSDVMLKREVHLALSRLKAFLETRGAKVALIYLPSGPSGEKQGMDDFLASGKSKDDLLAFASSELREFINRDGDSDSPREDTDASSRILWEGEPERVLRPLSIISQTSVAIISLPVADGEEGEGTRPESFILTEGGQLLDMNQAVKRNRWQVEIGDAAPVAWTKRGVQAYLSGHRNDGRALLEEITRTFSHYMAFDPVPPLTEDRVARVAAISALSSYFIEAFPAVGCVHFNGPMGSGKSKCQELHADLSFNGEWVVHTTTTAAIRRMAASGGVLAIDDTEKLNQKDDPDRYSLLLSGYRRGAVFHLVEDDGAGNKRVRAIPVYGLRTFSSIKELDDTLRSRTIPIPLVRSNGPQANRTPGIGPMPCRDFKTLRDEALTFALPRLRRAASVYAKLATNTGIAGRISGRDFEVVAPYLVVAYLIGGEDLMKQVSADVRELLNHREIGVDEERQVPVIRALQWMMQGKTEAVELSVRSIADFIKTNDPENATYLDMHGVERDRYTPRAVAKIVKDLKIGAQKKRVTSGTYVIIQPRLLASRAAVYGGDSDSGLGDGLETDGDADATGSDVNQTMNEDNLRTHTSSPGGTNLSSFYTSSSLSSYEASSEAVLGSVSGAKPLADNVSTDGSMKIIGETDPAAPHEDNVRNEDNVDKYEAPPAHVRTQPALTPVLKPVIKSDAIATAVNAPHPGTDSTPRRERRTL